MGRRPNKKQEIWPRLSFLLHEGGAVSTNPSKNYLEFPIFQSICLSLPFLALVFLLLLGTYTWWYWVLQPRNMMMLKSWPDVVYQGLVLFAAVSPIALGGVGPFYVFVEALLFIELSKLLSKYRPFVFDIIFFIKRHIPKVSLSICNSIYTLSVNISSRRCNKYNVVQLDMTGTTTYK